MNLIDTPAIDTPAGERPQNEYELRYRGALLGFHPSRAAAEAHAAAHHASVEDLDEVTIEPTRPVRLYCRGNLVDTFLTREGAFHAAAQKAEGGSAFAFVGVGASSAMRSGAEGGFGAAARCAWVLWPKIRFARAPTLTPPAAWLVVDVRELPSPAHLATVLADHASTMSWPTALDAPLEPAELEPAELEPAEPAELEPAELAELEPAEPAAAAVDDDGPPTGR